MTRDKSERVLGLSNSQKFYSEMIKMEQAQANTKRNWLKEKPYQLIYEERMKHEQCIKQEKEEDAATGLQRRYPRF